MLSFARDNIDKGIISYCVGGRVGCGRSVPSGGLAAMLHLLFLIQPNHHSQEMEDKDERD